MVLRQMDDILAISGSSDQNHDGQDHEEAQRRDCDNEVHLDR